MSDPHTLIADLAAELEIPTNGTLSRVLYKDDQVRVVGFAFDAGQELTEHTTPLAAVVQVISGRLLVTIDGERVEVDTTSWLHMSPSLPHTVHAAEPTVMILTLFRQA